MEANATTRIVTHSPRPPHEETQPSTNWTEFLKRSNNIGATSARR